MVQARAQKRKREAWPASTATGPVDPPIFRQSVLILRLSSINSPPVLRLPSINTPSASLSGKSRKFSDFFNIPGQRSIIFPISSPSIIRVASPSTLRQFSVSFPSILRQCSVDSPSTLRQFSVNSASVLRRSSVNPPAILREISVTLPLPSILRQSSVNPSILRRVGVNSPSFLRRLTAGAP